MPKKYWLMKSEPHVFSFDDLKDSSSSTTFWEGVRNYQARNFMRDEMKMYDLVLFYHSNCAIPGIPGIAEVSREAYPDHTSWDSASEYFDSKSTQENPRWYMVDIRWKKDFKRFVTLQEMRAVPELSGMKLLQKGQRLSIIPLSKKEFDIICKMGMSV